MAEDRLIAGIRCSGVLGKLSSFVDGELAPAEVTQIRGHVKACDWCERFGGEFAAAVRVLREQSAEQPERSVRERIVARIGK